MIVGLCQPMVFFGIWIPQATHAPPNRRDLNAQAESSSGTAEADGAGVAGVALAGCSSGAYQLPSDACHQPGPFETILTATLYSHARFGD